ncbi:MAG TPA: hypothetical protein VJP59_01985 [Gemmatimonadota bacterium]|nr:hypothetical protein [Gemmatimonadota bacterium]
MRTTCWIRLLVGPALIVMGACGDRGEDGIELGSDTLRVETDEDLDRVGEAVDEAVERTGRAVGGAMEETGRAIGEAADETGAAVDRAMEETGRAVERAGTEVKEEAGEGAGADSL